MDYKLYSMVDITHTGQYRNEPGKEKLRHQEQNFNTLLQTLGLRSNIHYNHGPLITEVKGRLVGFPTDNIIRVWRFDWSTERNDNLYLLDGDEFGALKKDFHLVPYINNLDEWIHQTFPMFVTDPENYNIVFHQK